MDMAKATGMKTKSLAIGLVFGLVLFMLFNFATTLEVMYELLGNDWTILVFALAVSMVDFFGLARVATPESKLKDEDVIVWVLMFVWILAAAADVILTAWWVVVKMQGTPAVQHLSTFGGQYLIALFPWAIAIIELAIRAPLVLLIGSYGDKLFHSSAAPQAGYRPPKQSPVQKYNIPGASKGK
jgi:hypothetical protein